MVGQLEHAIEKPREVTRVIGRPHGSGVGHLLGGDEIAPTQGHAIESERGGRLFHQPLEHVAGLGTPGAAIGVGGYGMGKERTHLDIDLGNAIRAREHPGIDRRGNRSTDGRDPGTQRSEGANPHREEGAVRSKRQFSVRAVIACLVVAHECLATGRYPAQGPPETARGPGEYGLLGVMLALGTEAAANIGSNHPDRIFGHAKLLGHELANMVWDLGSRVDRKLMATCTAIGGRHGNHRSRLHRGAGEALVDQVDADTVRRRFEGSISRSHRTTGKAQRQIARRLWMDLGGTGRSRYRHVDHRRQRFPVDLEGFGGVDCLLAGGGNHDGHRLTHMASHALRERRARGLDHH